MPLCPICSSMLQFLVRRQDKYALLHCSSCSFITSHPLPGKDELTSYYQGQLFNLPPPDEHVQREQHMRADVRRIVADMKQIANINSLGKKLLDCGGGVGYYAAAFAREGFQVTLIDIDRASCAYAREKYPAVQVIAGDVFEYPFKDTFDVIFCNQLIEHYPDPNSFLQRMKRLLTPNGVLIITTPNQGSKEFYVRPKWLATYLFTVTRFNVYRLPEAMLRFLRTPWICCDPPRHLHSFNISNLAKLIEKNGLLPLE